MIAQASSVWYAGIEPKETCKIEICALSLETKTAWSRFNHARGDTGEAQSSAFEEPMTEPIPSDYDGIAIRIVDISKSGYRSL